MAKSLQGAGLGAGATLMATGQGADVLGECETRALGTRALEAMHLDGQDEPLLEDWTLLQVAHIAAMEPVAPAAADRAGCSADRAVGLDGNRIADLISVDNALAYAGKNPVERAKHLIHECDAFGALPARNQDPARVVTQSAEDPTLLLLQANR